MACELISVGLDLVSTPSDIVYETPTETASTVSQPSASTPRAVDGQVEVPTDAAQDQRHDKHFPTPLNNMIAANERLGIFGAARVESWIAGIRSEGRSGTQGSIDDSLDTGHHGNGSTDHLTKGKISTRSSYQQAAVLTTRTPISHPTNPPRWLFFPTGNEADSISDGDTTMEMDQEDSETYYSSNSSASSVAQTQQHETHDATLGIVEGTILTEPTSRREINKRLRTAAQIGHAGLVRRFLDLGADLESYSKEFGLNALLAAAFYGHYEVASILIQAGASVEAEQCGSAIQVPHPVDDKGGVVSCLFPRPIHLAAIRENLDIINLLLDNNADVHGRDGNGKDALNLAIRLGSSAWLGCWSRGAQ